MRLFKRDGTKYGGESIGPRRLFGKFLRKYRAKRDAARKVHKRMARGRG